MRWSCANGARADPLHRLLGAGGITDVAREAGRDAFHHGVVEHGLPVPTKHSHSPKVAARVKCQVPSARNTGCRLHTSRLVYNVQRRHFFTVGCSAAWCCCLPSGAPLSPPGGLRDNDDEGPGPSRRRGGQWDDEGGQGGRSRGGGWPAELHDLFVPLVLSWVSRASTVCWWTL